MDTITPAQALAIQWRWLPFRVCNHTIIPRLSPAVLRAVGGKDELLSVGNVGLVRAAQMYDPTYISPKTGKPVKFVTFGYRCITNKILRWIVVELREMRQGLGIEVPGAGPVVEEVAGQLELVEAVHLALADLTELERGILTRRFFEGQSRDAVSREHGLGCKRVERIEKDALQKLADYEGLWGFSEN